MAHEISVSPKSGTSRFYSVYIFVVVDDFCLSWGPVQDSPGLKKLGDLFFLQLQSTEKVLLIFDTLEIIPPGLPHQCC